MESNSQLSSDDLQKAIVQFAAGKTYDPKTHFRAGAGKMITLQMVSNPEMVFHPPEWELVVRPEFMELTTVEEVVAAMVETEQTARKKLAEAMPAKRVYTSDRGEWRIAETKHLLTGKVNAILQKTVSFTGTNEEFKFI